MAECGAFRSHAIVSPDVHVRAVTVPRLCRTTADTRQRCHAEHCLNKCAMGNYSVATFDSMPLTQPPRSTGDRACQRTTTAIIKWRSMEAACRGNCRDFRSIMRRWSVRHSRCCPPGSTPTWGTAQATDIRMASVPRKCCRMRPARRHRLFRGPLRGRSTVLP